jgi:hypothetical protein
MDPMLASLDAEVGKRAALIGAPARLLPTYVRENGSEHARRKTTSLDEILYWIFADVTFSLAVTWEVAHRVKGEDVRRGIFTKQLELLEQLDPVWASRSRLENAKWHAEAGV